jgi:hypothetical protein
VLGFILVEVFLLKNIAKDLAGFSSLVEKGFPGYFFVLVHGVSSCDLGSCNIIVYG